MHEYTDDRADLRTGRCPGPPGPPTTSKGSALEPWRRHNPLHQVGIDRVVDTRVGPHVCRVTVTVVGDEMSVLELRGETLRPLVRRGRVPCRPHDHDGAAAGCRDLLRSIVGGYRPVAAWHRAPGQERAPGRCLGGQRARLGLVVGLSLIHISEPTRLGMISYAVFCL